MQGFSHFFKYTKQLSFNQKNTYSSVIFKRQKHSFRPRSSGYRRRVYPNQSSETTYIPNPEIIPPKNGRSQASDSIFSVHPLLNEPTLVFKREIEYMNLILGFEQRNIYRVFNANGYELGVFKEEERGIWSTVQRQLLRTRRPFKMQFWPTNHMEHDPSLSIERGFKIVNSKVQCVVNDHEESEIVAESKQVWHLWRRKYDLFAKDASDEGYLDKFSECDAPILSWEFYNRDNNGLINCGVDRNWAGLGLEFLTDVGTYVLRFDPNLSFQGLLDPSVVDYGRVLTPEERLAIICQTISIDFDFFSRHSNGNGFMVGSYGGGDV